MNQQLMPDPYVSLADIADTARPVFVDCFAEWTDAAADKRRVWELFATVPAPLGCDLAPFFIAADHPDFGVLKLTRWPIAVVSQAPPVFLIWHRSGTKFA